MGYDCTTQKMYVKTAPSTGVEGSKHKLYTIDLETGVGTAIGGNTSSLDNDLGANLGAMDFTRKGELYAWSGSSTDDGGPNGLFAINKDEGTSKSAGPTKSLAVTRQSALAFDKNDVGHVIAADADYERYYHHTVDKDTGALSTIGSLPGLGVTNGGNGFPERRIPSKGAIDTTAEGNFFWHTDFGSLANGVYKVWYKTDLETSVTMEYNYTMDNPVTGEFTNDTTTNKDYYIWLLAFDTCIEEKEEACGLFGRRVRMWKAGRNRCRRICVFPFLAGIFARHGWSKLDRCDE